MLMNFIPKPLDVLRRSITQRLSKIPPCPLTQLALTAFALGPTKRKLTLSFKRLFNIFYARLNQRTRRRPRLDKPRRKHVPARSTRCHLELEVSRSVDEF
jgi:hypothetical protein